MESSAHLSPDTMLGPYRIQSPLGAGGMGRVYRALDTRLDRAVAIKITSERFSGRFQQEARAISALNHPHICTLYDIGPNYLVMELVEGETLAERLRKSPLPMAMVTRYGVEIADALTAAHVKGITHRDLKPANVMLTKAGVKVLDFGLAKTTLPDETVTVTNGVIGTPAYMAPEQLAGKTCDARTDIYALGLLLYEAATGERRHAASSMDALPAQFAHVVSRCLDPDPENRWQSARDLKAELEWAARGDVRSPVRAAFPRWVWAVAAVLSIAMISLALFVIRAPVSSVAQPVSRFTIDLAPGDQLPIDAGLPLVIAVAPDGNSLYYVAQRGGVYRLYRRKRDELQASPIPGTEGALMPFLSPDGQWIGFASEGMLKKISLAGGPPVAICPAINPSGASWGPDNTIVFSPSWNSGLLKILANGGKPQTLTTLNSAEGETQHRDPHTLPDGRVLFTVRVDDRDRIEVLIPATGQRRVLVEGRNAVYLPAGYLIMARGGTLFAAPWALSSLATSTQPVPILEGVRNDSKTHFTVARDGTMAYVPAVARSSRMVWVDRNGGVRPVAEELRPFSHPRLSPDGTRLVVVDLGIWVYDLKSGGRARVATGSRPVWTPDGKEIVYSSPGQPNGLFSVAADGTSQARLVVAPQGSARNVFPLAWSMDGRYLAFSNPTAETSRDIWVLPRDGKPTPFLDTPMDERAGMFSPDGRWLVYALKQTGKEEEIYVQAYPGLGGKWLISSGGGNEPVWSRDGREIFYRSPDGSKMMAVSVQTRPGFSASRPRLLFEGRYTQQPGSFYANYDVSSDGQKFLMLETDNSMLDTQIHVVLNWQEEVKRRMTAQ